MGKASKWLLAVLIIGGLILPLFITGPSGRPIMSLSDWKPDLQVASSEINGVSAGPIKPNSGEAVYKWQDEQGRWHFSSEQPAPADGAQVERKHLPELENVIPPPSGQRAGSSKIGVSLEQVSRWIKSASGDTSQSQ